jgi:uncharacterized membrane protein
MARAHLVIMWGLIAAQMGLALAVVNKVPAQIATHWDLRGRVDGYGSWAGIVAVPVTCAFVGGFLMVLPIVGPLRENLQRSKAAYGRIAITVFAFMTVVHVCVVLSAMGVKVPMIRVLVVGMGIMFALIGKWIEKLKRNLWAGIRTPWTLASDVVWERTHRAGAKVFVVTGLMISVVGLFAGAWIALIVLVGATLGFGVWAMVYSYHVHRQVMGEFHGQ